MHDWQSEVRARLSLARSSAGSSSQLSRAKVSATSRTGPRAAALAASSRPLAVRQAESLADANPSWTCACTVVGIAHLNRSSFTGRPSKQFISHWPAMSISRLDTVKIAWRNWASVIATGSSGAAGGGKRAGSRRRSQLTNLTTGSSAGLPAVEAGPVTYPSLPPWPGQGERITGTRTLDRSCRSSP